MQFDQPTTPAQLKNTMNEMLGAGTSSPESIAVAYHPAQQLLTITFAADSERTSKTTFGAVSPKVLYAATDSALTVGIVDPVRTLHDRPAKTSLSRIVGHRVSRLAEGISDALAVDTPFASTDVRINPSQVSAIQKTLSVGLQNLGTTRTSDLGIS